MNLGQVWLLGLINPPRAFEELKSKPAPMWGLWAVLIRFIATSLTTTLALYLLGRLPFEPSRLTFLATEDYYAAEIFFLPLFGLAVWLLNGAVVHLIIRLAGREGNYDKTLNVIGMAMLIPMPVVWLWDWIAIALNLYQVTIMAATHSIFALWGVALYSIGFKKVLGLKTWPAIGLAILITGIYISLASLFIR